MNENRNTMQEILSIKVADLSETAGRLDKIETAVHGLIPEYMTESELADRLKVTPKNLKNRRDKNRLPFYGLGGRIRYDITEVRQWLSEHRTGMEVQK